MSLDALAAGVAAALGVLAAWDALAAIERARAVAWVGGALVPLRDAGREGRAPSGAERRRLTVLVAAALCAGGWMVAGPLAGLGLAAAGPWAALVLVRARRRQYRAGIARGAPVLARALADALAGGHSVHGAIVAAARGGGVPGPAGAELRRAAAALALGDDADTVLERLRASAHAMPVDTIVAAIGLQRRAGGDLALLLRDAASTLEASLRVAREARGATAQARFTGLLVCGLGGAAAALAELADPGYLAHLVAVPIAAWLLGCSVVLQAIAFIAIRRLGRVPRA